MRRKTFLTLFLSVVCTMALGSAVALATSTDDSWGTGQANQAWSASSTSFTFTSGSLSNPCTNDSASGSSVGATPDAGLLNMNTPTFSSCSFTVTTNSTNGSWQVGFWSDMGPTACPGGGNDENSGNDCVQIQVPKAGATINFGICTVTIAPTAAASVYGSVAENSPAGKDSITFTSQSVPASGCGITSGTLTGTYTVPAVAGSYLDDTSGTDGDPDS